MPDSSNDTRLKRIVAVKFSVAKSWRCCLYNYQGFLQASLVETIGHCLRFGTCNTKLPLISLHPG